MYVEIAFIENLVSLLHAKGWTTSHANIEARVNASGTNEFRSAYLYPAAPIPGQDDVVAAAIYVPSYRITDEEGREARLAMIQAHPTVTEFRLKTLLETIAEVEKLAGGLDLPSDFINPLTAMAEKLRQNALPAA